MSKLSLSTGVRNARLNAIVESIGPSPTLELLGGGAVLASGVLPYRWMGVAEDGTMDKQGNWSIKGTAEGTLDSFRLRGITGETIEGVVTRNGPMVVDNVRVRPNYTINVTRFLLQEGNV